MVVNMQNYSRLLFALFLLPIFFSAVAQPINLTNRPRWDSEPIIKVNPLDQNKLVIAYMSYDPLSAVSIKILYSTDGGNSWNGPITIPHARSGYSSADPVLYYDINGTLHLVYVDHFSDNSDGAIYLRKSYDNGQTWISPIQVISVNDDPAEKPIDRPWMATRDGKTIYVTSMSIVKNSTLPNRPYVSVSYDSGYTWTWTYLDSGNYSVGNYIKSPMPSPIIKNDTLVAVYPAYLPSQNPYPRYVMVKYFNGTKTYTDILSVSSASGNDSLKRAHLLLKNPANDNHLVFLFPGVLYGDPDILMIESFDGGQQWTSPLRLNDDSTGNNVYQDMLWGSFSQDGSLAVCWRDRRHGGSFASAGYDFYCTIRKSNQSSFSPNIRISNKTFPFDTLILINGNDFMSCAMTDSFLYVVWGAYDNSGMNIWFAKVDINSDSITSFPLIQTHNEISFIRTAPMTFMIESRIPIKQVDILDPMGRILLTKNPNDKTTTVSLVHSQGIHIIRVILSNGTIQTIKWTF